MALEMTSVPDYCNQPGGMNKDEEERDNVNGAYR
jgi:hypothetical protein